MSRSLERLAPVGAQVLCLAFASLLGCSSDASGGSGSGGSGGALGPGAGGAGVGGTGAGTGGVVAAGGSSGGSDAGGGGASASSGGTGGTSSASGGSGGADHDHGGSSHSGDHCVDGYPADARDAQITDAPDEWVASNGDIDLVLPAKVLEWMGERVWEESHDAWHNVRRCGSGGFPGGGSDICQHTELVPADQECENAEDGYQFLVMHRHMMDGLRQAFPQHQSLFAGFPEFPFDAQDVPEQWRSRWGTGWSEQILQVANVLENIEDNLAQFPTEGDLGQYIQCGGMANGASSIHGALHFKWVVNESPHSLGKQTVNIDNYMFWKLHGWIDQIWERYRIAKGQQPDEPKLKEALVAQCREMHQLGLVFDPDLGNEEPLPVEHGVFHETVRPIFEEVCSGCHSESSPDGNLTLGGHVSSADVVANLVNVTAIHGGQFKRVVPSEPNQSWLYLKVAGMAAQAGCTGTSCNAQVMPPTGQVTLTQQQLSAIQSWIAQGAPAPTQ